MATILIPRHLSSSIFFLFSSSSTLKSRVALPLTFHQTPSRLTIHQKPSRLTSTRMSHSTSDSLTTENDVGKPDEKVDDLVQYVVLRRDLIDTWPLGSVVTQGCHASVCAIWMNKDDSNTVQYCSPNNIDDMRKVTLEVKGEPQILNLSEKLKAGGIVHKLWIERPENFPTCLATKPYPKSIVSAFFKKLKLCK